MNVQIGFIVLSACAVAACQAPSSSDGGTGLVNHQEVGPTRVRLRLVQDNHPAVGLAVRALDEASSLLGQGATSADGVAQCELARAGDGWLVAHDGHGQGVVLHYTAQAAGLNDLGERSLGDLADQPEILAFRGLGFEERVTTDPVMSVSQYALAGDGRFAVVRLVGRTPPYPSRLVRLNVDTREQHTLRDPTPPELFQVDQRYVAWRENRMGANGFSTQYLVVYDVLDEKELANFELQLPQSSTIGAMWSTAVGHVSVLLAPDPSSFGSKAIGLSVTAEGVQRVDLGELDWVVPYFTRGRLWLQELRFGQYSNSLVIRDPDTFAEHQRWNLGRNGQVLVAGDECAVVATPDGIGRVREGQDLSLKLTATPQVTGLGTTRANGRFATWVNDGGHRRLASGSCTDPLVVQTVTVEGDESTSAPYVDASAEDVVRLVQWNYQGLIGQMKIWEWRADQGTASLVYTSPSSSDLQYDIRFAVPLVEVAPLDDAQAQWWVGLPSPSTPRTWVRQKRTWPMLSGDRRRLTYLMNDPILESQQLFVLEVQP